MNKQALSNDNGVGWVVVQVILMVLCALAGSVWHEQWTPGHYDWLIALGLTLIGAAFGLAGVVVLGRNRTIYPEPRADSALVRHGIYRHVRHPLYSSVMFLAFGWGLWRHSLAALATALLVTLFLAVKASNEEMRLQRRFRDYAAYRKTTRRFLPWLF